MIRAISDEEVNKFWKRHNRIVKLGFRLGLIRQYGDGFLERLRDTYYGGIPASILLLNPKSCKGKCYDRAVLACFAFKDMDYQVVHALIDTIRYNKTTVKEVNGYLAQGLKVSETYPDHCFVEVKIGNLVWVFDTTDGLVYEKHIYYLINHPQIRRVNSKEETESFIEYVDIANANLEKDKWVLPNILPIIEQQIEECSSYKEKARREIQIFKDFIGFDQLCEDYRRERDEHLVAARKLKKEFKA